MTPEHLAKLYGAAFSSSRGWSAKEFADLLASPFCFLVGDPSGFALGRVIADESELLTIATCPSMRRQGIARKCLEKFHAESARRGAISAFLEVAADNDPAIALYESAGWVRTGQRKNYYARSDGKQVDAHVLSRRLP